MKLLIALALGFVVAWILSKKDKIADTCASIGCHEEPEDDEKLKK